MITSNKSFFDRFHKLEFLLKMARSLIGIGDRWACCTDERIFFNPRETDN